MEGFVRWPVDGLAATIYTVEPRTIPLRSRAVAWLSGRRVGRREALIINRFTQRVVAVVRNSRDNPVDRIEQAKRDLYRTSVAVFEIYWVHQRR